MKKTLLLLAALAAFGAHATGKPPTPPAPIGITAHSSATAAAAAIAAGGTAWAQGGRGGAGGIGLGGTGGSNTLGNVLAGGVDLAGARFGGDTYVPRQTPPSYAPPADRPTSVISCRLTMGGGGAGEKASLALGIPIGNDALCLHAKRDSTMEAANKRRPGTFTNDDFLRNDCTVEGMDATEGCKALAQRDQQRASSSTATSLSTSSRTASLDLLP